MDHTSTYYLTTMICNDDFDLQKFKEKCLHQMKLQGKKSSRKTL